MSAESEQARHDLNGALKQGQAAQRQTRKAKKWLGWAAEAIYAVRIGVRDELNKENAATEKLEDIHKRAAGVKRTFFEDHVRGTLPQAATNIGNARDTVLRSGAADQGNPKSLIVVHSWQEAQNALGDTPECALLRAIYVGDQLVLGMQALARVQMLQRQLTVELANAHHNFMEAGGEFASIGEQLGIAGENIGRGCVALSGYIEEAL